jgi:hypothetical protein
VVTIGARARCHDQADRTISFREGRRGHGASLPDDPSPVTRVDACADILCTSE